MDIWSRLFGRSGVRRRQTAPDNSQQRLIKFRQAYGRIAEVEQNAETLLDDASAAESIKATLQQLSSTIHDESRSPPPHVCISYSSSEAVYIAISSVGWMCRNELVLREAIGVFNALVDSEEDGFLDNKDFAVALTTLVERTISAGNIVVNLDIVSDTIELLFGIAAKIRLRPEILPVWFTFSRDRRDPGGHPNPEANFMGIAQKEEFPLCYHLIEHVHHEGRIGDFARTGLLYIFETASTSRDLEEWLVESDIPTMMATGLGALYSQLSRKISIEYPEEDMPIALALSDRTKATKAEGAVNVFSGDLQLHLHTFLSYFTFWQDLLELCNSTSVKQTLLDHLKVIFLQQLLYPSILESSDRDGGSSVAVMYYLRHILFTIDYPELVQIILEYLLAVPDMSDSQRNRPTSPMLQKRQSSLIQMMQYKSIEGRMNPTLFSLTDLILNSVRSPSSQTVVAALKLIGVLVDRNHDYVVDSLIRIHSIHSSHSKRTIGSLEAETEAYLSVAEGINLGPDLDDALESHLKEISELLEAHPCSSNVFGGNTYTRAQTNRVRSSISSLRSATRVVEMHRISVFDPLLLCLYELLGSFFTNDIEVNLSLTECFVALASCPYLRLEGWMVVEPSHYAMGSKGLISDSIEGPRKVCHESSQASEKSDDERLESFHSSLRTPTWSLDDEPRLLASLRMLGSIVNALQEQIISFSDLLTSRKATFHTHDALLIAADEATQATTPSTPKAEQPTPVQTPVRTPAPSGYNTPTSKMEGFASLPRRLLSDTLSLSSSQSNTSRGRQMPASLTSPAMANSPFTPDTRQTPLRQQLEVPNSPSSASSMNSPTPSPTRAGTETSRNNKLNVVNLPDDMRVDERAAVSAKATSKELLDSQPHATVLMQQVRFFENGQVRFLDSSNATNPKSSDYASSVLSRQEPGPDTATVNQDKPEDQNSSKEKDMANEEASGEAGTDSDSENIFTAETSSKYKDVSLNHVLTNAVVLQEFVLELVALLQVRASLFGEIQFSS